MMSLNLTLIGQMITFGLFVWFTMKFVWPPLVKIMQDRQEKIADGLAAADKGQRTLELAEHQAKDILTEAKAQAASILEKANQRANHIIEESKGKARVEGERLLRLAEADVQQQYTSAEAELLSKLSQYAVLGAEKILKREVDQSANAALIDELVSEI